VETEHADNTGNYVELYYMSKIFVCGISCVLETFPCIKSLFVEQFSE